MNKMVSSSSLCSYKGCRLCPRIGSSTSSSSKIGARSSLGSGEVGVEVTAAPPGAAMPRSGAALPHFLEAAGVCCTWSSSTSTKIGAATTL